MLSVKQICELTGRKKSTVYNWLKEGLAPTDEKTVLDWKGFKEIEAKGAARDASETLQAGAGTSDAFDPANLPPAGDPGAPHCLKRLQEKEVRDYQRVQAAELAGDHRAIRIASQIYDRTAATLLKYEKEVEQHLRALGSLISRSESLEFIKNVCTWIRLGMVQFAGSDHIEQIRACGDNRAGKQIALSGMISGVSGAFRNSLQSVSAVPPDFALLAIQELRLPGDTVTDPQQPGWHIMHQSDTARGPSGWVKVECGTDKQTVLPATPDEIVRAFDNAVINLPVEKQNN